MIKKSDLASIILIAAISLVAAFFIGNALINTPENRSTKVEVVNPISSEFGQPSDKIFNDNAIDITEKIQIGGETKDPFANGE